MSKKNVIAKASLVYILISFVNKGIGIITIPIFTRLLSTSEMGMVTTWISWMTILLPITSLSLSSGSFYIAMNEFKNERDKYLSSSLFLISILTLFIFLIYIFFSNFFNRLLTLSSVDITFMFIYLMFSPAFDFWILRKRYEYKLREVAIVSIIVNTVASLIAVLLVIIGHNKGHNLGQVRVISTYSFLSCVGIFFFYILIKNGGTLFDKKYWKFAFQVSTPLVVHSLAKNVLDVSDRTMISYFCGKDESGIYGILYQISSLSLIIWAAINNAFAPFLFEKLDKNDNSEKKTIAQISTAIIVIYGFFSIILTAVAPEIVFFLTTKQYFNAVYIIPPIAAGVFLTCIYNLFANVILYHKKTIVIMVATLFAAILNVGLNAMYIPRYGFQAAAYTTLIAFVILSVIQGISMHYVHKELLYEIKKITIISVVVICICMSFNFVYGNCILRFFLVFILFIIAMLFRTKIIGVILQIKQRE